ncbi:aldo/keto reductase [Marinigracilibium pacificum]|uniref:Aldo/keto reductase n=1 Tax=Marinigracilibium pacificum TaxID=2729599 RepID=A0A848J0Z7_9BACT|nr:aldo/keto reductase [Marinigracilibium pacificum]NMM48154.1 aldo/keto reductase [Marinigracilibium pacificum]
MKFINLANNDKMPIVGLGTWKSAPGEVYDAVVSAVKMGYRHIDCAAIYQNEKEIGNAFKYLFDNGIVKREDLWITSKLWNNAHKKDNVIPALKQTLADLQLDYLDLYLIHWPVVLKDGIVFPEKGDDFASLNEVPLTETWNGMELALESGLTKHIGVSNFNSTKLKEVLSVAKHKPEMNQVELHPLLPQNELISFCKENDINMTAYSPLGSRDRAVQMKKDDEPNMFQHPVLKEVAEELGIPVPQLMIAWAVNRGTVVIPKSTNPEHMKTNLEAADIQISEELMNKINSIGDSYRYVDGSFWTMEGSPYEMTDLWEMV